MLAQNATHNELNVMKASLQTIDYVLEELEEDHLDQESVQLILSALIEAMNKPNADSEVYEICAESFLNSLCMARSIFESGQGNLIF